MLSRQYRTFAGITGRFRLQLCLRLPPADAASAVTPRALCHLIGGVLDELRGDVCVALGLTELGVPEDLLHDADVDALLQQESRCRVAGVVNPRFPDFRGLQERAPVFPVTARVDRLADR